MYVTLTCSHYDQVVPIALTYLGEASVTFFVFSLLN